mmetsp:Transcript_13535/g.42600  ORF Transcript_13535/g.42600 Transcript_13535/m.42600 type:complete len:489 (-) Transcript_13535:28-1494(-)
MMIFLVFFFPLFSCLIHPTIITDPSFDLQKSYKGTDGKTSTVHRINVAEPYHHHPLVASLNAATPINLGVAYATLLGTETKETYRSFLSAILGDQPEHQAELGLFLDTLWNLFYAAATPTRYLDELRGMQRVDSAVADVSRRFYVLANMPADSANVVAALEQSLERGWPVGLKALLNTVVAYLERMVHSCDALGVWGNRTLGGSPFTSRNLDYNSDTGINAHKLITVYNNAYATVGFAFGLGALAGMSMHGLSVSEMNLDNSDVTLRGLPFPLRLRYVLEEATDLQTARAAWDATNNTNSFNFMIGSAADNAALALETVAGFTAFYSADSPVERDATVLCDESCHKWTNETGFVHFGRPMPNAVWRTNHAFHPRILETQEPLFNDTIFRYNLIADALDAFAAQETALSATDVLSIVATVGTKGPNFDTCAAQPHKEDGMNVMSIVYDLAKLTMYTAWESGANETWAPAACSPYVEFDLAAWTKRHTDA